jgi:hypothetical protein
VKFALVSGGEKAYNKKDMAIPKAPKPTTAMVTILIKSTIKDTEEQWKIQATSGLKKPSGNQPIN